MFSLLKILSFLLLFVYSESLSCLRSDDSPLRFRQRGPGYAQSLIYRDYYDVNVTISMNKTRTKENKEMFSDFIFLNYGRIAMVTLENIDPDLSFIIAQVHTHQDVIEMYKPCKDPRVFGQNIGLYIDVNDDDHVFFISNNNVADANFYLSVHGYGPNDPIPGGCNMESHIPIPPSMDLQLQDYYYYVDIAPPMGPSDPNCLRNEDVSVTFYMMYQPVFDFSPEVYFDGIQRMMTYENITKNGFVVPQVYWNTRRMLSLYYGIGTVFAAIAHSKDGYSIYVPIQSYGCQDDMESYCIPFGDLRSKILALSLFTVSVIVCYTGHRYIFATMMVQGFYGAGLVFFITMSVLLQLPFGFILMITTLCAFVFTMSWSLMWMILKLRVMLVLIAGLNTGFMVAAIAYYTLPSEIEYLVVDYNFWSLYLLIVLMVTSVVLATSKYGNIVSCAFMGSYGLVVALDVLFGGNFKYILINAIRRAVIPNFNNALLLPPFQTLEVLMLIMWVSVALTGMFLQYKLTRGFAAFPVWPRHVTVRQVLSRAVYGACNQRNVARNNTASTRRANERTPLLS